MTRPSQTVLLGPRHIPYVTSSGDEGVGAILITLGAPKVGNGSREGRGAISGWVDIALAGETCRLEARGADDLQVAYDLIRQSGAWLVDAAKSRAITLFDDRPDPVVKPMDVFDG